MVALRMKSTGPIAWARSLPMPAPRTGRIALDVWLRHQQADGQPALRLGIEGQRGGQPYYRYATLQPTANARNQDTQNQDRSGWMQFTLHVDDLPSGELSQLRVRFDLMSAGEVWLDDVQVYDLSFTRGEHQQLSKIIALADLNLRDGKTLGCYRTLTSYWPRYVNEFATQTPRMAENPRNNANQRPRRRPLIDRVKQFVPRITIEN